MLRKGKRGEACCEATDVCDECFQRMPSAKVYDDLNYEIGITYPLRGPIPKGCIRYAD
jgi:hypothetical protein